MTEKHLVNQRIIQHIVDIIFEEQGKLIGEDGFLSEGLSDDVILELQINALIKAKPPVADKYKQQIQKLFIEDYKSRSFVFEDLIFPSANLATNYFGADFLHEILINQPSPFERDQIWLGGDRYGIDERDTPYDERFHLHDLQNIIDPYGQGDIYISEYALHNEHPLILGWALATLNQSLRERLRIALNKWAIKQPYEFICLLDKLILSNDPQIHEDLASITLGLASKLKDKQAIQMLAEWALKNIFTEPSKYKSVIVRQGFRSIVERAFQYRVIPNSLAEKARPHRIEPLELLPLDQEVIESPREEFYPIVHDLAWYVIKKSFNNFLDYTLTINEKGKKQGLYSKFVQSYLRIIGVKQISAHTWAVAAAIAYMKSLGFSRHEGNNFTQATHGSKSKIFTLEEKYTWLAVHYIQGYLSDYLPLKQSEEFIKDYTQITSVPNPTESINTSDYKNEEKLNSWIIQEELVPKLPDEFDNYDEAIKIAVEKEPEIILSKWLDFENDDVLNNVVNHELLALFNYTSLHDIRRYVTSSIDARAVLVEKGQGKVLLDLLQNHENRTHFITHIDNFVGSPNTYIYSNPTDIVWMDWIEEQDFAETYYTLDGEEKKMLYTITSVTANTVEGENERYIPSKLVRSLLGITDLNGSLFLDSQDNVKAFLQIVQGDNYDMQEMVLVSKKEFLNAIESKGQEVVWFVDLLTRKNPLNELIKSDKHPMKSRKYFVFFEGNNMISIKIWDARFSNVRDKEEDED